MAASKLLQLISGRIQQVAAITSSAGAADDGKIPALDATGRLDTSMMPVGLGADTKTVVASENLAAGDFVNLWNDTGTLKARKADAATSGKEADGFVLSAVSAAANAIVYFEGTNNQLTGLTVGSRYYLSAASAGLAVSTPPSGANNVVQYLGRAVSATEITFEPSEGVILA